ncbi:MAG: SRPBCC domain-containing protein [Rhizobacter sp.]|nr:SRPBCC domain-containing protein [Rhizobacter sp.]
MSESTTSAPTVIVRRDIEASADELFDAWLDPASLAVWMRPGDITHAEVNVDPKIGGDFEIVMHSPTGAHVHKGQYRVIERPHRLVFTWLSAGTPAKRPRHSSSGTASPHS